ncbi:MAG: hypothetical protein WA941_07850 [Nitrososphaeraceae archaeon]
MKRHGPLYKSYTTRLQLTVDKISKIILVVATIAADIVFIFVYGDSMKTYMTLAMVAAVAVMLVASAAVATEDAFAGKKKKNEKNQALSQANACGNGKLPLNVFCSNSASQIQGDENAVSTASYQASS